MENGRFVMCNRLQMGSAATGGTREDNCYCLQGNMIGRDDKNGPQGCGVNIDICFTLNATDRHCVVYRNGKNNNTSCDMVTE